MAQVRELLRDAGWGALSLSAATQRVTVTPECPDLHLRKGSISEEPIQR